MLTIFALAFWISTSLLLDLLVMPSLYLSGMMSQPGFAGASYSLFWLFNRMELVCAAVALTGLLVLRGRQTVFSRKGFVGVFIGSVLLSIALIYTYLLTPHMSALGMQLNLFDTATSIPAEMNQLHGEYWALEMLKLAGASLLLGLCCRNRV
ncbi:hypothetical protein [Leptolyngbya sp. 'hensonii']|uniref:hypothetical protein n=1 Tax=Leptolyngbya sp. 'hensonii' TaxID=1922337 RepID=UPI001C0BDBB0|nr:hypothetical protein [Leptolyngbya sp. 'hensonii']